MEIEETAVDARRPLLRWLAWAALVLFAAAVPLVVSAEVFPHGSPDRDDAGYLSQAAALEAGELTLPAETHDPFFLPFLSGVQNDRVIFKYQPAWPALIAASETVSGTPRTALVVTGVAATLAVAAMAYEVTLRRRAALAAGFLFACSPWFIIQSGTYLAYPASAALLCGATAAVLRGVRTGSGRMLVLAGALIGLGVFHRPYDAVLGLIPLGVWLVVTRWRDRALWGDAGRIALGASPFALLFFAYNRAVTGHLTTLAFSQVGPMDRFGFGARSSLADPGQPGPYDFTIGEAWRTVIAFAGSLPDWLPGGLLVLPLAYLGFRAIANRRVAWLVIAQGVVFPLGYFVWWGAANARAYKLHDLLGPLYWFPLLVTAAVLGGAGLERLAQTRPSILGRISGGAIVALGVTGLLLVSAVTSGDTMRAVRHARGNQNREVAALRPGTDEASLVIAPRRFDGDLFVPVPVPAGLDGKHLIAMDPSAGERRFELLDQHPGRAVTDVLEIHLANRPFEDGVVTRRRLHVRSGPEVVIGADVVGTATPYLEIDGNRHPLTVTDGRIEAPLVAKPSPGGFVVPSGEPVDVVLGIDDRELHWLARVVDGEVQLLDPPTPIRHYAFPGHAPIDAIEDVSVVIRPT